MTKKLLWGQLAAAGLLLVLLILSDLGLFFPVENLASRILLHFVVLLLLSSTGEQLCLLYLDMDE